MLVCLVDRVLIAGSEGGAVSPVLAGLVEAVQPLESEGRALSPVLVCFEKGA